MHNNNERKTDMFSYNFQQNSVEASSSAEAIINFSKENMLQIYIP